MKTKAPFQLKDLDDFEVFHNDIQKLDALSQYESYEKFYEIVKQLPTSELINRGWINSKDDMISLVPLFQSVHSDKIGGLFRKSDTSNNALCSIWQSRVSEIAKILIYNNAIKKFDQINKSVLSDLAKMSPNVKIIKELPKILSGMGIILIYEKALPRMKLDGVVFKLESGHPVVGISFRYSRIDHFWFTLMHELAHILLHYEFLDNPIFDDLEDADEDAIEVKANRLAKNSFVERSVWRNCPAKYTKGDSVVRDFAAEISIHPAIIAGMLQREQNTYNIYRKIVDEIDVRREVFEDG